MPKYVVKTPLLLTLAISQEFAIASCIMCAPPNVATVLMFVTQPVCAFLYKH